MVVLASASVKQKTGNDELWEEYRALGLLRWLHSLALWKDKIRRLRRVKGQYVGEYVGQQQICLLGWPLTQKEVWTKDRLTMSFLTFEDETVIFPGVYERYGRLLFD